MAPAPKARQRGVQLTPEALELLTAAVEERWRLSKGQGKLTRQAQADMMGVSLPTRDRILSLQRVDQSSLTIAFKALGIPWKSSYCEPVPGEPPEEEPTRTRQRLPRALIGGVAIALALFAIGGAVMWPKMDPQTRYLRELDTATEHFREGSYDRSESHLAEAIRIAQSSNLPLDHEPGLKLRGDIAAARGRLTAASEFYKATIRYRELRDRPIWPSIHEVLAALQIRTGEFEEAQANLDIAEAGFVKSNEANGVAEVLRNRGCLAAARGDLELALDWFAHAQLKLAALDSPGMEIDVRGERAMVLLRLGRIAEAQSELDDCLAYWTGLGHERWIGLTEMRLGEVAEQAGRHQDALALAASAHSRFLKVGDEARTAEAEALLARLRAA